MITIYLQQIPVFLGYMYLFIRPGKLINISYIMYNVSKYHKEDDQSKIGFFLLKTGQTWAGAEQNGVF